MRAAENGDIIDALIALHQTRQKRHKEQKQQRAAAQQGAAPEGDVGWDF